jgi:transcription initiation factor IIE alpha subunit
MTEQRTIIFTCPKCGCMTPSQFTLPDDVSQRRAIRLDHECFHCDEPLCREYTNMAELRRDTALLGDRP